MLPTNVRGSLKRRCILFAINTSDHTKVIRFEYYNIFVDIGTERTCIKYAKMGGYIYDLCSIDNSRINSIYTVFDNKRPIITMYLSDYYFRVVSKQVEKANRINKYYIPFTNVQ